MAKATKPALHAIYEGKRWGFVDRRGAVVVPPTYLDVRNDALERIAVKDPRTKRWGFIDTSGTMVIAPEYDAVNDFVGGLASVMRIRKKRQAWSFIDPGGAVVISDAIGSGGFVGDFALVRRDDNTGTWIDRTGACPFEPEALSNFEDGLATARDRSTVLCGFIDTTGTWVVAPKFETLGAIKHGLALAPDDDENVRFVDRTGKIAIKTKFQATGSKGDFHDGLARVFDPKKQAYGYIDPTGKLVIAATFGWASTFHEGLASAGPTSTTQGVIDRTGKWVVEPAHYEIRGFRGGLARAFPDIRRKDTFGLIDTSGAWVWRPKSLA